MGLTRVRYSNVVDTDYKQSCRIVTTTNITLSGSAPSTYDGVSLAVNDRILVNGQNTGSQNGIYIVSVLGSGSNGTWIRSPDAATSDRVTGGMSTIVTEGTYAGTPYRLVQTDPITLGTTSLSFASTAATVSGTSKSVQYNNAGFIAGATYLVYDNSTGNITVASSTPSVSTTTGALIVKGGVGVAGNVYTGGTMSVSGVATFNSNVVIVGNLTTLGNTFITNSTDLSIQDSIINLHTPTDLTPLLSNDGQDIGLKFHYYDTADSAGFLGRDNPTGYLVWEDKGTDTGGVFNGTSLGTFKVGNILLTGNTYRGTSTIGTAVQTHAIAFSATSGTAPSNPQLGDKWYDTTTDTLYEWFTDGTGFYWVDTLGKPQGVGYYFQPTAPTPGIARLGDLWYDTDTDQIYTLVLDAAYNVIWVDYTSKPATIAGLSSLISNVSVGNITPYSNVTYNIGTTTAQWANIFTSNLIVNNITSLPGTNGNVVIDPDGVGDLVVSAATEVFVLSTHPTGALIVSGGTTINGNLAVTDGSQTNYYNSGGAGKGVDIVTTATNKVGYLNLVGGSGSSGLLTFGNINSAQAVITTGTDNSITIATKNPNNGANISSSAFTIYSDQTAKFFSDLTVTGNHNIGSNTRAVPTIYYSNSATAQYSALLVQRGGVELWLAGANPSENYVIRNNATLDAITVANVTGNVIVSSTTVSANNTSGALVVKGGVGVTGNLNLTYNPVSAIGSALQLTGKDTQGGTGYFDFLKATNTTSGATNPNKTIRLNSTGSMEVINSAYTATLMSISDAGFMSVSAGYQVAGKQAVNGPAFRAYVDANQTITSGSQQKVTFGTENFDTNSNFASSTFTPTLEGYYQLNAVIRIAGTASTGEIMLVLYKNGAEYARGTNESGTEQGSNFYTMMVSDIAYANGTTDNFDIRIQQTSGADRTTTAGSAISHFSGCMLRGA